MLDSILKAFQKIVEDDKNEVKPIFRSREWNADEREKLKPRKNSTGGIIRKQTFNIQAYFLSPLPQGGSWPKKLEKEKKN